VISDDRAAHLAKIVVDGIWGDELVDYTDDDGAMRAAKNAMLAFQAECEEVDNVAKQKVASLKRGVVEGSSEWEVLYRKYFEEELNRRGG
jgi:hypothetical protein